MSSSVEILKEAFFDTEHVLRTTDQTDQYTVGFSDNAQNMWVKLYLISSNSKITDVKYEVKGCQYLVALASLFTNSIINQDVFSLADFNYQPLVSSIDLPKNRQDRLFLLEDAVKDCINHFKEAKK